MSRPRIYTPEEIRERKRLRGIEYRKRNAAKIRAYKKRPEVRERHAAQCRKWREDNPDYQRDYYAAHRDAFREYERRYREKHRESYNAHAREYAKAHPRMCTKEQMREESRLAYVRRCLREMVDCDYYAHNRARNRAAYVAQWKREGKDWGAGRPAMRIPDWCVRGGVLDTRSQWLFCNATDEQKAYARELAIERKKWRMNNEWRIAR